MIKTNLFQIFLFNFNFRLKYYSLIEKIRPKSFLTVVQTELGPGAIRVCEIYLLITDKSIPTIAMLPIWLRSNDNLVHLLKNQKYFKRLYPLASRKKRVFSRGFLFNK